MKKILLTILAAGLATVCFAETDKKALKEIKDVRYGRSELVTPSVRRGGYIEVDVIREKTAGNGVSVDGVDISSITVDVSEVVGHLASVSGDVDNVEVHLGSVSGDVDTVEVTAPVSTTQATITVTCKNLAGATLATNKTFMFWFTSMAQQTTPSEAGIASWSYVAHGDLEANFDLGLTGGPGTNYVRVGSTHTDGTMDFLVTADSGPWSNRFCALGPNGSYTETTIRYITP